MIAVASPAAEPAAAPRRRVPPFAVFAAIVALGAAVHIVRTEQSEARATARRMESGVQRLTAAVRNWEQAQLARTRDWADDPAVGSAVVELPASVLAAARAGAAEGVRAVALLSPDGRIIASSAPTLLIDPTLGQRIAAVQRATGGTASVAGPVWPTRARAPGSGEWLFISAAPVRGADGSVSGVLAVFHDVNAPLRAARQLLRQDPMLEAYLVSEDGERLTTVGGVEAPIAGPVGSAGVDRVVAPAAVSQSAQGLRVRPYTGALGRKAVGAWTPAAPLAASVVYEVDASAIAGAGARADALAAALVLAALGIAFVARSATTAVRQSGAQEAEVLAVVDSAPHAVLVADARGRVTRANTKAAMLFDASVLSLVGTPLDRWLKSAAPLVKDRIAPWLETAAREGVAKRADGREADVEVRVGQGEFAGAALFVVVLLDRAELQGAVRAARDARDDVARARTRQQELVQAMHQEIRTPMSRVMGMAHLLNDSTLSPVQQGYVDSLMRSAQTMMTFVTDVLDLAKIEQGTLQLVEAPFEVRAAMDEVGTLTAQAATTNQVRVESRVTERTPQWVMGDAGRFRQVLITLVGNGIRFAANGRVSVKVDGEPTGTVVKVHVKVADTGPGMDAEQVRRLFAKDPTTVSKLAGGGLGLSMVKHLVELMGGRIEVKSLQGEGTTFQFTVTLRAAHGATNASGETARLAGTRALVVDASEAEGVVTREWLRSWGMRVETTTTAEEAMGHLRRAAAEGDPVEVALVDRQTLGEQADGFARRLRAEPAIAGTGLLIATSAPVSGEAERLAAAGCDAVVPRPLGAAGLARSLSAVVQRPRAARGNGTLVTTDAASVASRRGVEPVDGHINVVEEPSAPRRVAPEPVADSRLHVLLAEDNRVNQIVATNLLQRLGCRVEVVRDGAEAVKVASRNEFDVILMDIQMPHLDGLAATTLIRRLPPPFNGPHIIAMGTSASPEEKDRYLAAGMDDAVPKPLTPESVQAALERRPAGLERTTA